MIGARVDVRAGWGADIAREINEQVRHAVADASEHGAKVAAAVASRRSRSGLMADIRPVDVIGTPDGWEGGFRSQAFYSGMQSRGTKRGVAPLRHEEQGLEAAKQHLRDTLNRL